MKVFGTLLTTFVLSLSFAFAQTTTTTTATTTSDKTTTSLGEAKAACCAGKSEKGACCKGEAKGHADAAHGKDVKAVSSTTDAKPACCAGKDAKGASCKGDKASAEAANTKAPKTVVITEEVTETKPTVSQRRVIHKSNKNASLKPQAAKE